MSDITTEVAAQAPPKGFAGAEYNQVALGAELEGIVLLSSRFEIAPDLIARRRDWKLSYGRKMLHCNFSPEDENVGGTFEYHVTAKVGKRKALVCTAQFAVFYQTPADASEAGAAGFCRNVGVFAAYPYFRSLVAMLAANANINLPPLPVIASRAHIPPKAKDEK